MMKPTLAGLLLGFMFVAPVVSSQSLEPFILVSGAGYEGAIIPASSPWQIWNDPAIRSQHVVTDTWTPSEGQVAAAESGIHAFLGQDSPLSPPNVNELTQVLPRMKRHYAGIVVEGERLVLLHGFPDDDAQRWKTEVVVMFDGGCRQFWADYSETRQRVTWIRCGPIA